VTDEATHKVSTIQATTNHPFWDATTSSWTDAGDLKPGDHLLGPYDDTSVTVTGLRARDEHTTVYNLTVAEAHTYYVVAGNTPVLVHNCNIPAGFAGQGDYNNFVGTLNSRLSDAGFGDTQAAFQGSSVTGRSFVSGRPFGAHSDYDIALGGQDIFGRAQELGIPLRSSGTRTGPLNASQLDALGLSGMRTQLKSMAGRPVNFVIYKKHRRRDGAKPQLAGNGLWLWIA
jgi:hypothetical protein